MSLGDCAVLSLQNLLKKYSFNFSNLNQRTILLTGATGFFGTWLLAVFEALNKSNISVNVIALSRKPKDFIEKERLFKDRLWLSWKEFDLAGEASIESLNIKCDYIIHAATDTSLDAHSCPSKMLWNILDGWRSILTVGRSSGCRRILLISSGAVYGKIKLAGASESDLANIDFTNPSNAYALGKQICEQSAAAESKSSTFDVVTARCFSFVGPGLPTDEGYAIGNFIRDAITGNDIQIKGDGTAVRSYLYVGDLVIWLLTVMLKGNGGEAYNVGSDKKMTIEELANLVQNLLPGPSRVIIENKASAGFGGNIYFPITDKTRALGLNEYTPLRDAILDLSRFTSARV